VAEPQPEESALERGPGELRRLPAVVEPAGPRILEPAGPRSLAAERAHALPVPVMAAAGGFLVGLATWVLARALRPRRRALAVRRSRSQRALEVTGSRSFLVDVHLLKR